MVMDPSFAADPINGITVDDHTISPNSDQHPDLVNEYEIYVPSLDVENPFLQPDLGPTSFAPSITPSMATGSGGDSSSDDCEFRETVLKYISQILMEDNIDDKPCLFYDPLSLQVTEKSFYDVLGQKSPPSPKYVFPVSNFGTENSTDHHNFFTSSEFLLEFRRGLEEASKFLPMDKGVRENSTEGSRGRKNHEREDTDLEGRSNKLQSAVYMDQESDLSEMFDKVLLSTDAIPLLCANNETIQKKQGKKKDSVDVGSLLILCAQAVAAVDIRSAKEFLRQIRHQSSPSGDGSQRLAHYFANALEARLAGSGAGTQNFQTSLVFNRMSAFEILKAYKVHVSTCPFKRILVFFIDQMIYKVAEKSTSLHIIDFGIQYQYGFQWPILIQKLSEREGGPPKLRITGIQLPQPGFRPTERIDETGRRLAKYCERFNVPFEYHVITSHNWETIQIEELKIDGRYETLAVNCSFRYTNLRPEENSSRDEILNLIRRINPDIFVHSVVNGSYDSPFFVTRFKEALHHFSAMYDILDVTLPPENQERLMFEREFYGGEIMNVIACEGLERVERPENYKQWQIRTMRAGFRQLPLDRELMNVLRSKLKEWYHKDFVVEEDNHWLLQGWKGRIVDASSCWVPA